MGSLGAHPLSEHPERDRQPQKLRCAQREPLDEDDAERDGADGEPCGLTEPSKNAVNRSAS